MKNAEAVDVGHVLLGGGGGNTALRERQWGRGRHVEITGRIISSPATRPAHFDPRRSPRPPRQQEPSPLRESPEEVNQSRRAVLFLTRRYRRGQGDSGLAAPANRGLVLRPNGAVVPRGGGNDSRFDPPAGSTSGHPRPWIRSGPVRARGRATAEGIRLARYWREQRERGCQPSTASTRR